MRHLFSLLVMLLAVNAIAADWTIIRSNEEVRIYQTTLSSNGTVWMSVYPLNKPSVDMLEQIGLPKNLWGHTVGLDGIYSSELTEVSNQLTLANQIIDNDQEYINELSIEKRNFIILSLFLAMLSLILLIILAKKSRKR